MIFLVLSVCRLEGNEMYMHNDLTQEEVKEVFEYDSDTGIITNRAWRSNVAMKGAVAGALQKGIGYWAIRFKGKLYYRSRLAWLYTYGYWPENFIDHRNRIRTDDRIENLREVTQQCNMRNQGLRSDNHTGVTGVNPDSSNPNIFKAGTALNRKRHNLCQSKDFVEVCAMRFSAEQCLDWPDCNEHSSAGAVVNDYVAQQQLLRSFP